MLIGRILFLTRSRGQAAAAYGETLHDEEERAGAGQAGRPLPQESEEQRTGSRSQRWRDLGSVEPSEWGSNCYFSPGGRSIEKPSEVHTTGKTGAKKHRNWRENRLERLRASRG